MNPDLEQDVGPLQRKLPVFAAVIAVLTLCVYIYFFRQESAVFSDLIEFIAAAKMAAAGHGAQIYVLPELFKAERLLYPTRGDLAIFIPPFGLPWLMPLAMLTPDVAPDIWKGFLVICFALSLFVLQRVFKPGRVATCWFVAAGCLSGCTYDTLRIDQTTPFMLLGLSLALWAFDRNRPILAGAALSMMLLKPQLLIPLICFLLGARQYVVIGVLLVCTAVLSAVGFALVGADGIANYFALLQSTIFSDQYLGTSISCTLRGQLFRMFPEHRLEIHYLCLFVIVFVCLWAFKIGRERAKSSKWWSYGVFAVMPSAVGTALYCFFYDVLLLMPTVLVFMHVFRRELPAWSFWVCVAMIVLFMPPISTYIHYDWVLSSHVLNPHFAALAIFAAVSAWLYEVCLKKRAA